MDRSRLARHLVQAALAWHDAALWQRFPSEALIAVHVPDHAEPVFASIMGPKGDHGLNLFRGPGALRTLRRLLTGESGDQVTSESDIVAVSFSPPSAFAPEYQELLREAKFAGSTAPHCMAKPPGRRPRPANRTENELLLWVLTGILAADAQGLLRPVSPKRRGPTKLWTLRLSGKPVEPEVRAKFEEYDAGEPRAFAPATVQLPDYVQELPRTEAAWWLAVPLAHGAIKGDDRELRTVLVFDATADKIVKGHMVLEVDPIEVADVLFAACRDGHGFGPPGLPAEVAFDRQDLHDAMAAPLAAAGIRVTLVPEIAHAREILAGFAAFQAGEQGGRAPHDSSATVPAADDLDGWKRVDLQVSQRFAEAALADDAPARKASSRYFGKDLGMLEQDAPAAFGSFGEWYACTYRSRPGARTLAEGLLASGALPPAFQILLAARAAAPIGLYRIAAVRAGEGVELEDVLHGSRVSVPDRLLAATAREGVVLFGKVYPAGAFTFLAGLSAPLPGDSERTLQQLESEGLEVTEAGLQQTAHRLGRLWQLRADQATSRPQLVNTDGDELMDVRASFAVRDPAAVRAALLARDDVEVEGGDEADADAPLVWFRPQPDGSRTLLARLEFLGGELVVTANSEERLRKLRTWLLPVAGVLREVSATRRDFLEAPVDDRLRGPGREEPAAPELLDAITGHMRTHYRSWLDEPIPALGGKTPRQAVKTADGRRKVARLIRTTPDPMGPSGPLRGAVPREEMLRELGLEGQGEAEA